MDDCAIYALAPDTGRLSPFGSHPSQRSTETSADALIERPMLQRVVNERVHMTVDVVNEYADPAERAHLRGLGRTVAERVLSLLIQRVELAAQSVSVSASIGIASRAEANIGRGRADQGSR